MSAAPDTVDVEKFVIMLQVALQARAAYGERHKLAEAGVTQALTALQTAMRDGPDLTIGLIGGQLAYGSHPLYRLAKAAETLSTCLAQGKIDKITWRRATGRDEMGTLLSVLDVRRRDPAQAVADIAKLRNITLGGIGLEDDPEREQKKRQADMKAAAADFSEGVDVLEDVARSFGGDQPLDVGAANAFVGKLLGRLMENRYPLLITASLKRHDEYSFVHSMNVAVLSLAQAQGLGFNSTLVADVGMAGFLHDAGKLEVSGEILRKAGKLTEAEFEEIKLHPVDGARLLVQIPTISPLVAAAAFEHHLRFDGAGYPRKRFGGDVNLVSMIVAIADVYDAMRSKRAYRGELMPEVVHAEMMKMAGSTLQADLLDAFFKSVGIYPPGTLVQLNDGQVGMVVKEHPSDIRRPTVEIWYTRDKVRLTRLPLIDLAERQPGGGFLRSIDKSVSFEDGYELPVQYRN